MSVGKEPQFSVQKVFYRSAIKGLFTGKTCRLARLRESDWRRYRWTYRHDCTYDTSLYIGCIDADDEQFDDFRALEQQLMALRKADGKPYKLLKLPMPEAIFDGQERLPATYANFLIINGAVLCPTYNQPRKDVEAMKTIAQAYPGREVIGIDARTIIRQHGSVHCLTMQFPRGLL